MRATKFFNVFDDGAVVANDDRLTEMTHLMRNFGFWGYDDRFYPRTSGKMTEVAAAMGLTNLENIDLFGENNGINYRAHRDMVATIPELQMFAYGERETNNNPYIVVEVTSGFAVGGDRVIEVLHTENVLARRYCWRRCHSM